mgnify:CR=1 FL=1
MTRTAKTRPDGFAAWTADNPRVVSIFLGEVNAVFVPYDDIEAVGVAHQFNSPLCLDGSIQVWTPSGVQHAHPGEWIVEVGVINERDTYVVMPNDVFRREFVPLDADADELARLYDQQPKARKGA